MEEFFKAVAGGVVIALFTRFVLSGSICKWCETKRDKEDEDDDDGLTSSASTINAEIHKAH